MKYIAVINNPITNVATVIESGVGFVNSLAVVVHSERGAEIFAVELPMS
jgi:hypothetical protein